MTTTPSTLERGDGGTDGRRTVPLTQLIHLMAEYEKLGAHRQTFQPAPISNDTVVRGCALVAGGLLIVGVICAAAGSLVGSVAVGGLAIIPLTAMGLRGQHNRRARGARLDLFDHGMTVYHSGEEIVAFRWDSVQVRQLVIPFRPADAAATDYSFVVTGPGAMHAEFDEHLFADAREWGPHIQSAVTATQLPMVVAAIDAEQTVDFGEIAVCLDDLRYQGASYRWERVQTIDSRDGMVRIKVDGRWHSLAPVGTIPNFYIFNEVAERLRIAAAMDQVALEAVGVEDETDGAASDVGEPPAREVS
ncbi:hypothetical protein NDR87_20030 [Nocardia sp. CDC159]|uniref:Uncharacterized protein n=1 Tax=Nocardia pulmonis TaxID=2951408 RepID=A0A9X2E9C9_9NOCA|nr:MULTISPECIES: DUF6585 family protein [Nocardia]MCM6776015.1 hypothetical protein [Nocardia pulmonis]MCM6788658.1 hypothetical protein [Nocardia sp. CDC159]